MNYFRITGYCPQEDFCFIMDANGMFEEIWEFSSLLVCNKLKVLEVTDATQFIDINIGKIEEDKEHFYLRASASGKPEEISQTVNGVTYKAIKVGEKIYIPDMKQVI